MKHIIIILILTLGTVPATAQWFYIAGNLGTGGSSFLAFGVHDSTLFASGSNSVVDRYNISTQSWAESDHGISYAEGGVTSFASLGRYLFANTGQSAVAYESTNDGASWFEGNGNSASSNGHILFGTSDRPFTIDPPYIAISRDTGVTWDSVSLLNNGSWTTSFFCSGSLIFATVSDGLSRSLDEGTHWVRDTTPLLTLNSIAFIDSVTFGANGRVLKSSDSGSHWTDISIPGRNTSFVVSDSTFLFAGTDSGVYVSLDYGTSWRAASENLPGHGSSNPTITALCVFDTLLVADVDAGGGIDYTSARPIKEMVDTGKSGVQSVSMPSGDSIAIYPNPSMGTVTILAGGTSIFGVSILNVLGEDVLDVPNIRESEISLDFSELPSGTYFMQIQTANGIILRKIVKEE